MATKHTDTCLQKAADDEPIFVLRAQDELAFDLVRLWALRFKRNHEENGTFNVNIEAKYNEAIELSNKMAQWPTRKIPD
jgi:hypothetical protein